MRDVAALKAMANANRSEITRVFSLVGLSDISDKFIDAVTSGDVTDATIGTGTHLDWMALKRRGTPDVLRNVRWAGRNSFDAYQVKIDSGGYTYTFAVPKVCGNISLVSRVANAVTTTAAAPPPPPPPPPRAPEPPPPPEPPAPEPPQVAAVPPAPAPVIQEETYGHWIATGFVGVNMTMNVDFAESDDSDPTLSYGGQIAYMWRSRAGVEAIADLGPAPGLDSVGFVIAPGGSRHVNAYMLNFIGGLPIGGHGRFQPYGSVGMGKIQFSGDVIDQNGFIANESETRWGWNAGVGTAAFYGHWGVRGDVRYYRAHGDDPENLDTTTDVAKSLLTGLSFWRANAGLAFRF
jgi:hypothetical protein